MSAALFRHIGSRKLEPQLHTHAVVANMTCGGAGRWKSIEPTELHRNRQLIGAYYLNELSMRLVGRGYSIVPAVSEFLPGFEMAGYDRRMRDAFSSRRKQMEGFADDNGWDHGKAAERVAVLAGRKGKAGRLHAMLRTIWAERGRELGEVPIVRRARGRVVAAAVPSALRIAWDAMRDLEERQSVFAERDLEALALACSRGRHTLEELRGAIGRLVKDAHLVEAPLGNADRAFVTDWALKWERKVIAMMKAGIGAGVPLGVEWLIAGHLAKAGLTEGQGGGGANDPADAGPDRGRARWDRSRQERDAEACARAGG